MQIRLLFSIISSFLIGILALQNTQSLEVHFLFFDFKISMTALIIAVLISGILISSGLAVFKELQYKRIIKSKNKNIVKLKKEISALNGSVYGQNIHTKANSVAYDNITSLLSMKTDGENSFLSELKKQANVETASSINTEKSEVSKTDNIEIKYSNEKSKIESTKSDIHDTMRISTILSGFDDLEDDDFSIKNSAKKSMQSDWFTEKKASKSRDIIDELIAKNDKKTLIDIKSGYSKYISDVNPIKNTNSTKSNIQKIKNTEKKFKRIKKNSSRKINSEQTFLKSLLDESQLKALDELSAKRETLNMEDIAIKDLPPVPENSCSIMHLYKQNTDPEKTLSTNLIKERFNWKSNMYKEDDVSEDDAISKNLIKNKINSLFSIGNN